jgi:hypothetical protein
MKTLLLWIILSTVLICQPHSNPFYWEINSLPGDSSFAVYFTFRISYDKLVFIKKDEKFISGVKGYLEVYKDTEIISRNSSSINAVLDNYSLTNSPKSYVQGLITVNLPPGKYNLLPELEFVNTERIVNLPPSEIELKLSDSLIVIKPICL